MKTSYLLFNSENCYVMEYPEREPLRMMIILMNVIIQGVNNFSSGITQTSGFQLGVILPARGHVAVSADISGYHKVGDAVGI